jgi:alkylhydroperoxidase family enzyme
VALEWLADAGLTPPVHARLVELEASLWGGAVDDDLLRLVRARAAQLVGDEVAPGDEAVAETARTWTSAGLDERTTTVLRWIEQFVIDPSELTDADAASLTSVLSAEECATLTTALAVFEALARTRVALSVKA